MTEASPPPADTPPDKVAQAVAFALDLFLEPYGSNKALERLKALDPDLARIPAELRAQMEEAGIGGPAMVEMTHDGALLGILAAVAGIEPEEAAAEAPRMNRQEAAEVLNSIPAEEFLAAVHATAEEMAAAKLGGDPALDALTTEDEERRPLVIHTTDSVLEVMVVGRNAMYAPFIGVGATLVMRALFRCLESQPDDQADATEV